MDFRILFGKLRYEPSGNFCLMGTLSMPKNLDYQPIQGDDSKTVSKEKKINESVSNKKVRFVR